MPLVSGRSVRGSTERSPRRPAPAGAGAASARPGWPALDEAGEERLLTASEVAPRLAVSTKTLYRWAAAWPVKRVGPMPVRLGATRQTVRWPRSQVDAYLAGLLDEALGRTPGQEPEGDTVSSGVTGVYDRWHKTRPQPGEAVCAEHELVPSKEHGKGKRYLVRYRDLEGEQRSESVWDEPTAGEPGGINYAEELAVLVRIALREGRNPDLPGDRRRAAAAALRAEQTQSGVPTVSEYIPMFLAQEGREDSTITNYENRLRLYVADSALGGRPINDVRRGEVKRFFTQLKEDGASDPKRTSVRIALSAMFSAAIEDDEYDMVSNPVAGIKLTNKPVRKKIQLTWADINRLVKVMPSHYQFLIWLGALQGLRAMEAAAVTTDAFVIPERRLYVVRQHQRGELREKLKTDASRDYITTGSFLINRYDQHMAEHRQRPTPEELAQRARCGKRLIPEESWKLVTVTPNHTAVAKNTLMDQFRHARAKAGLHEDTGFRHLRHFMDAVLIASGVEPRAVQARMRHARLDETLNTYGYQMLSIDWENAPASWTELYGIPEPAGLPDAARVPAAERTGSTLVFA
ncbi:tyrosine-type recombinase/integrase [Streptomyces hydrogenans]|uniref:tyrosine-type recombinase/integrase n=1 Tax=Streptomyces hydrogenans TaxID=1873719 RepID=UPI00380528E1